MVERSYRSRANSERASALSLLMVKICRQAQPSCMVRLKRSTFPFCQGPTATVVIGRSRPLGNERRKPPSYALHGDAKLSRDVRLRTPGKHTIDRQPLRSLRAVQRTELLIDLNGSVKILM